MSAKSKSDDISKNNEGSNSSEKSKNDKNDIDINRRGFLSKFGWTAVVFGIAASQVKKEALGQGDAPKASNPATIALDAELRNRGFTMIRRCDGSLANAQVTVETYRKGVTTTYASLTTINGASGSYAVATSFEPQSLETLSGQFNVLYPFEGTLHEEVVTTQNIMDKINFSNPMDPDLCQLAAWSGCSACSGCALCLLDGPVPDLEIAGLIGLFGLGGCVSVPNSSCT